MENNTIINLTFSYNWNKRTRKGKETGKLDCSCFSTLRIDQPKYQVGQVYRIILEEKKNTASVLGYARCLTKMVFEKDKLTEGGALLDTGYNRAECLNILNRMYPNSTPKTPMCFLVLKYMTDAEIAAFSESTMAKLEMFVTA